MTRITRHRGLTLIALLAVTLAAIVLAVAALGGCSSSTDETPAASSPAAAGPITVTDDAGKTVTLDSPATKVVSIAPANTEIAFALGAGDKVVGDTTYCDYPEEAKAIAKIGDFSNPSVEKIVALEPDLVLAAGGIQAGLRAKFEKLGMQVFVVDPTTLDELYADLGELGQLMGVSSQSQQVVDDMQQQVAAVEEKVAGLETPKVFFEIYGKPLMTAGSGTFIDELVTRAGGVNVGAQAGDGFPEFSTEVLVEQDPVVYIAGKGAMSDPGAIAARPGFDQITAIKDGRVFIMDDNLVVRPGPRLAEGLAALAKMIHPEAFPDASPQASATP